MLYSTYTDKDVLMQTARWSAKGAEFTMESFTVLTLTDTFKPFEPSIKGLPR